MWGWLLETGFVRWEVLVLPALGHQGAEDPCGDEYQRLLRIPSHTAGK